MVTSINGAVFKDMIINAAAAIELNKSTINDLNVFPVPDGDTGTNMSLTMAASAAELNKSASDSIGKAAKTTASALLRGARGNSGVILSLLFRGIAKTFKELDTADTKIMAQALTAGVNTAYNAVMKPTEGTILTVSRLVADAAVNTAEVEEDFEVFFDQILQVGEVALANTIEQNPVLKKAGVIDAGGKGYLCILDGMSKALRGEMLETSSDISGDGDSEKSVFSEFDTEDIKFAYCTEFIVSRENVKSPDVLRDFLNGIGDSIVVVDDDEIIKVHVHTNDPGAALTQAIAYGSLLTVKVENMREQHSEKLSIEKHSGSKIAAPEKKYGVVAVCAGDGMAHSFRDMGVDGIITGGQTMNPSTADILAAVNQIPAEIVFVLPNNKNIIMAAEQCISISEKKVVVIPTKTVPQGITAMFAFDPAMEEADLTAALTESAQNVHTVQITYAARDSDFDGHSIHAGEYLALLESSLIANESDFNTLLDKVAETLSEFDPELITMFYGADVKEDDANAASDFLADKMPDSELTLINGGQPVYYYMISAE